MVGGVVVLVVVVLVVVVLIVVVLIVVVLVVIVVVVVLVVIVVVVLIVVLLIVVVFVFVVVVVVIVVVVVGRSVTIDRWRASASVPRGGAPVVVGGRRRRSASVVRPWGAEEGAAGAPTRRPIMPLVEPARARRVREAATLNANLSVDEPRSYRKTFHSRSTLAFFHDRDRHGESRADRETVSTFTSKRSSDSPRRSRCGAPFFIPWGALENARTRMLLPSCGYLVGSSMIHVVREFFATTELDDREADTGTRTRNG